MKRLLRPALLFIALALYATLYGASEVLVQRNGHSHPLFKLDRLQEPAVDWVVLGVAFYLRTWNEDRFADAKLLRRTPWDASIAARLARYVRDERVNALALLDYASGFSKINNRELFERDAWEGEAQFDRVARPSASAIRKRIAYLYPDDAPADALTRYLGHLAATPALARVLAAEGARFADSSTAVDEPAAYFDTDHLNRSGLATFITRSLMPLLQSRTP